MNCTGTGSCTPAWGVPVEAMEDGMACRAAKAVETGRMDGRGVCEVMGETGRGVTALDGVDVGMDIGASVGLEGGADGRAGEGREGCLTGTRFANIGASMSESSSSSSDMCEELADGGVCEVLRGGAEGASSSSESNMEGITVVKGGGGVEEGGAEREVVVGKEGEVRSIEAAGRDG